MLAAIMDLQDFILLSIRIECQIERQFFDNEPD